MHISSSLPRRKRSVLEPVLIYGEGACEAAFLKHLKSIYACGTGIYVKIKHGKGGSPKNIVRDAANESGYYYRIVVVMDFDKSKKDLDDAITLAKSKGIIVVGNTPCLEAMLLSILEKGKDFSNKTSAWCKKEFERKYIPHNKRENPEEYRRVFPSALLVSQGHKNRELAQIISSMQKPVS